MPPGWLAVELCLEVAVISLVCIEGVRTMALQPHCCTETASIFNQKSLQGMQRMVA
jgi:hypothetical protein